MRPFGITLELRSTLKTCVTGSDGSFRFDDVETGHHTMTALENGKVVGYMAFYLTEDITTYLGVSGGAQVIYVDKSGIGVDLVLQLEDNGLLTPLQASTIPAPVSAQTPAGETPPTTPPAQTTAPTFRIPQTGDAARPALLLVLALCSAVLFMLLWRKKAKSNCIALKPGGFDRPGCFLYIRRTK
ncbi:GNAT family N-acetyltransferase [Gemmiger formicilis]|nr:GNAT family N-acetyltransferase [Gemmiger formicilis]